MRPALLAEAQHLPPALLPPPQVLLRRFRAAVCTTTGGAAGADLPLLYFSAALAAALPYRRGDEVCTVVQEINAVVAARGEDVQHELARALAVAAEGGPAAAAALGPPARASLALSMLLLVKRYLKGSYAINSERIAGFAAAGAWRRPVCMIGPLIGLGTGRAWRSLVAF